MKVHPSVGLLMWPAVSFYPFCTVGKNESAVSSEADKLIMTVKTWCWVTFYSNLFHRKLEIYLHWTQTVMLKNVYYTFSDAVTQEVPQAECLLSIQRKLNK